MTDHVRGRASGWSVFPPSWKPFGWRWSAYGPTGGTMGSAKTKEEAERRAQQAMSDLERHTGRQQPPPVPGETEGGDRG